MIDNFLPVDLHKATLWKQRSFKLLIVLCFLLWQPEANSLCPDHHAFLLHILCHEHNNAICALQLLYSYYFDLSLAIRSSSTPAL